MKPAANAVENAIAAGCSGPHVAWRHSTTVAGASVTWKPRAGYLFFAKASEDAAFTATATPTRAALRRAREIGHKLKTVTVTGEVKAYLAHGIKFNTVEPRNAGSYTYRVKLAAALNPARAVTLKRTTLR